MTMNKNAIGNNITSLLTDRNMTQKEFAKEINATEACVSRWASGKRIPTAYALYRIARLFGVTVDSLLVHIED